MTTPSGFFLTSTDVLSALPFKYAFATWELTAKRNKESSPGKWVTTSIASYWVSRAWTTLRKYEMFLVSTLRKHAYSNILKILSQKKNENFQIKNSDIFHVSAQNIACGYSLEPPRRDGSNEYPQSMFLSRNKKNNVYPVNPSFTT